MNALGNVIDVTLNAALDRHGVDHADVDRLEVPFPDMLAALDAGRVDAAFLATPFKTIAEQSGDYRAVGFSIYETRPELIHTTYFVSKEWAEDHGQIPRTRPRTGPRTADPGPGSVTPSARIPRLKHATRARTTTKELGMCAPGTLETVRERIGHEGPPPVSRRAALATGAGAALAAAFPGAATGHGRRDGTWGRRRRLVDLSHEFRDDFPAFPGAPATSRETAVTIPANGFYGQVWTMWEHVCTHMDVPAHFIEGGRNSAELAIEELIAPIAVVDISRRVAREPDTVVTPDDLARFERRHGRIPRGAVVAMHSGWEARVGSVETYRNTDAGGTMRFPGFGKDAVDWLLERRRIRGIGVDTMSLDHGSSSTFDVHLTVLGADRYGVENLRNLAKLPPRGATLYLGLIPWREGSGGPCRAFASV